MAKVRADNLLTERGLAESRARAQAAIMAGLAYIGEQRVEKPGQLVDQDAPITLRGDPVGYVSRGGLKLKKALDEFGVDVSGLTAVDAGASTGGFTDCLLRHGAAHVWAVDVGYGQLAWKLRNDSRVTVLERTNIRHATLELTGAPADMAVADLSFISLNAALPALYALTADHAQAICLVKPQFEAGRGQVGKKGVVRDPGVHRDVLSRVCAFCQDAGWYVKGLTFSPIRGPEGNIEYLALLDKTPPSREFGLDALVEEAFNWKVK